MHDISDVHICIASFYDTERTISVTDSSIVGCIAFRMIVAGKTEGINEKGGGWRETGERNIAKSVEWEDEPMTSED